MLHVNSVGKTIDPCPLHVIRTNIIGSKLKTILTHVSTITLQGEAELLYCGYKILYANFTGKINDQCTAPVDCSTVIPDSNCTDTICHCIPGYMALNNFTACTKRKFTKLLYHL